MSYTTVQFDAAATRIFGEKEAERLRQAGLNRPQMCEIIAKRMFTGRLTEVAAEDLAVVRWVATNLWDRSGDSGLTS